MWTILSSTRVSYPRCHLRLLVHVSPLLPSFAAGLGQGRSETRHQVGTDSGMLIGDSRFRALRLATGSRDAARDRGGGRALSSLKPERRANMVWPLRRRWKRWRSRTRSAQTWRQMPCWSPTRRVATRPARRRSDYPTSLNHEASRRNTSETTFGGTNSPTSTKTQVRQPASELPSIRHA